MDDRAERGLRRPDLDDLARAVVSARPDHNDALDDLRHAVSHLTDTQLATYARQLAPSGLDPWGPREQLKRLVDEERSRRCGRAVVPLPIDT